MSPGSIDLCCFVNEFWLEMSRSRASGSGGWDLHCFVHEIVIGNEQVQGHLIWRLGSVLFCS